jgi:hypothetical protein
MMQVRLSFAGRSVNERKAAMFRKRSMCVLYDKAWMFSVVLCVSMGSERQHRCP